MIFEANSPDANRDFMDIAPFAIYDGYGVSHDWVVSFDPETGEVTKLHPEGNVQRGLYSTPLVIAPYCPLQPDPLTNIPHQGDMKSPCLGQMKKAGCEIIEV